MSKELSVGSGVLEDDIDGSHGLGVGRLGKGSLNLRDRFLAELTNSVPPL